MAIGTATFDLRLFVFGFTLALAAGCGNLIDEIEESAEETAEEAAEDAADDISGIETVDCAGANPATTVTMQNIAYQPKAITVPTDSVVRWTNQDSVDHTVTSGSPDVQGSGLQFDSGTLGNGDSYCLRFTKAAAFTYYCELHPDQMRDAAITVQDGGS